MTEDDGKSPAEASRTHGIERVPLQRIRELNTPATDAKSLAKRRALGDEDTPSSRIRSASPRQDVAPADLASQSATTRPGQLAPPRPRQFIPKLDAGDATAAQPRTSRPLTSGPPDGRPVLAPRTGRGASFAVPAAETAGSSVAQENQKPGSPRSEWDLAGAASGNIEGFTADISYDVGRTVEFKVNTDARTYRIEIYRLGYYGGLGARRVHTLLHDAPAPTMQADPVRDPATGLVDAGTWTVTDSWPVPAGTVSGIYLAKLVRQDGVPGESHIPFVLRDETSTSDIVFQTSDGTWQAYNGWGGANLYGGNGPGGGTAPGRALAVSYNRPIGTRDGIGLFSGPQDYVFGAEYSALRWLERNGYDVSYISGVDASRDAALIRKHRVFTSTGHDEYWTGDQRRNVEAARDAGVNLIFMSGNEVYWKTRLAPSIDGLDTPHRSLICYKETRQGPIDPSEEWTGTWRDPTHSPPGDGGHPENALTGTIFQVDSYRSDSIEIPHGQTKLRFWRNTSVAQTAPGQVASLGPNYLGYEWDESPDNGSRPPGLIELSSTTLAVSTYLMDYGNTTGLNTATHHLTLYRAPSGALVFGAGTVYWAWGLDEVHDLDATPVSRDVQQAMVNLLADMGVQPRTLQDDLTAATPSEDRTPPVSTISTPAAGASLGAGRQVVVSGSANDAGGLVAGVEVSTDDGATWHPASGSPDQWTYLWTTPAPGPHTIRSRAIDDSCNVEAPGPAIGVTVVPSPTVTLFHEDDVPDILSTADTQPVELGVKFTPNASGKVDGIRFYKGPQNTGQHVGSLWSITGTRLATGSSAAETPSGWQEIRFPRPVPVAAGTTYVASYHAPSGGYSVTPNDFVVPRISGQLVAPASAGPHAPNGVFARGGAGTFPTEGLRAATNYWVDVLFSPAATGNNRSPVAVGDSGFSTARDTALAIPAAALLANDTDPDGDALSIAAVGAPQHGTVTFDGVTQTVVFTPAAGYTGPAGFTYTASDGRGGTATASVALAVTPTAATAGLFGAGELPAIATVNDPNPVELGVKIVPASDGMISAIRFFKGPGNIGPHTGSLWSADGARLATGAPLAATASGWQEIRFPTPVAVTAGTTYIASYHTASGNYAASPGGFATTLTRGRLTAPASAASGGNGVFVYGAASAFPTGTFNANNYWVDVVFEPAASA